MVFQILINLTSNTGTEKLINYRLELSHTAEKRILKIPSILFGIPSAVISQMVWPEIFAKHAVTENPYSNL